MSCLVRLEQRPDRERRIFAECRDPVADLLRVPQRLGRLRAQPGDDRDAAEAEDQERVVRVADDAGELGLEQPVQDGDRPVRVRRVHLCLVCRIAARFGRVARGPNRKRTRRAASCTASASSTKPTAWPRLSIARVDVADAEAYKAYVAANAAPLAPLRRQLHRPRLPLRESRRGERTATSSSSSRRTRRRSTATARPTTRLRCNCAFPFRQSTWSSSKATTGRSRAERTATPLAFFHESFLETHGHRVYPNTQLFIDGDWCAAASGKTLPVVNPATGDTIGTLAHAEKADLDRALEARRQGLRDLEEGLAPSSATRSCARPPSCCASAPTRSRR